MDKLEITLLGHMRVHRQGIPLGGLTRGKRAALLAYLAVEHDQDHSRETLASLLWPEADPHTARSNLRQQLFHLRKTLGDGGELIRAGRQYVRLHLDLERLWVDLHALQETAPRCSTDPTPEECRHCLGNMAERAALYQGPLLQDLPLEPDNDAFNDWLQSRREAARRQTLTLLERLSHCHEALGTPERALGPVQGYLAAEPLDEAGHRLAMRLLAADGHSDAVSAQYAQCRSVLERELGVAPSPETEALARELVPAQASVGPSPVPNDTSAGERRQETVLHAELSLPAEADPEVLLERLEPLMERMRAQIEAQGGVVDRQYGTGLLAYFGFPTAREGVAVDAVQSALNIRQEIQGLAPDTTISIGIHTGMVIVEDGSPDPTGLLARQADRLRGQLAPGEIGLSAATRELVRGFFRIDPEPTLGEPPAYRVLAAGGGDNRLLAADSGDLSPLQGRTEELDHLRRRWSEACQGRGSVVHISGEAGVGKSRLLRELVDQPGDTPMLVRHYRCQRQGQGTPLHPVRAILDELFGLQENEDEATQRRRLQEFFAERPAAPAESPALFAELLGLSWPGGGPDLTATEKRDRLLDSLVEIVAQRARQRPTVLVLEDVHWADSATLELSERVARQAGDLPLLFLCTSRPLDEPECVARLGVESLPLAPLTPRETDALIRSHIPQSLDEETIRALRRQSDGIPLFAEELAQAVGSQAAGDAPAPVPASLEDLLHERLDRLGAHKRLAQLAASIGREVEPELLATMTAEPQSQVEEQLGTLVDHGILQRLETVTGPHYQFRHALIRQAAYHSQVRADRRESHRHIADSLLSDHPKRVQLHPEELAHHLTEAGRPAEAIPYWLEAAEHAFEHWAVREADELAQQGLDAHGQAGAQTDPTSERQLVLIRAKVRSHLEGYGSDHAEQLFQRALALAPEGHSGDSDHFSALYGLYMGQSAQHGHPAALDIAHSLLDTARESGSATLLRVSETAVGSTSFWLADYDSAEVWLRRACAWDEPEQWQALATPEAARERIRDFSRDPFLDALIYLGMSWWDTGHAQSSIAALDQAEHLARRVGHAYSLAATLAFRAALHHFRQEPWATRQVAQELEELGNEQELPVHSGFARLMEAWVGALSGDTRGLEAAAPVLGTMRHGVGGIEPVVRLWVAELYRCLSYTEEGLEQVTAGLEAAERLGERRSLPELYRLRGELLAMQDPDGVATAMDWLRSGLEEASAHGSATHALRCANALARLLLMRGEVTAARDTLAPYWEALPEDAGLPDWQAARRILGWDREPAETSPPDSP
jgi:DNA-binding SARP family transcriptional activator/tetratricopeptide (TPR) repeat protein